VGYTFYCNKIKLQNCFIIIHYDLMQFFNQTIQPHTNNYEENNHTNNLIIIIIIIRTFVTRAVSANILNLRRRYSCYAEIFFFLFYKITTFAVCLTDPSILGLLRTRRGFPNSEHSSASKIPSIQTDTHLMASFPGQPG